jgi:hypothetical protein
MSTKLKKRLSWITAFLVAALLMLIFPHAAAAAVGNVARLSCC